MGAGRRNIDLVYLTVMDFRLGARAMFYADTSDSGIPPRIDEFEQQPRSALWAPALSAFGAGAGRSALRIFNE